MTASWPDGPAATSKDMTVRAQLDYIVWIAEAMEPVGLHRPPALDEWRRRVQLAYSALIDSFTPGHGDPLPPDVPPTVRPGSWPDVPAHSVPGMHVRHQLTVLRTVAGISRTNLAFPRTSLDVATWTARVQTAYDALNHGSPMPMPESHRTIPPPAPERPHGSKSKHGAAHAAVGAKPTKAAKSVTKKATRPVRRGSAKK